MANNYFNFKQFSIEQKICSAKVNTDCCLFGAWVANYLQKISQSAETLIDIGTGTGVLSLMIAQKNPQLNITAIELDKNHFETAKNNFNNSTWKNCINVINEDIKSFFPLEKFDYIVCNPPFFENDLLSPDKQKNNSNHSTSLSLKELVEAINNLSHRKTIFFILLPTKRLKDLENLVCESLLNISEKIFISPSEKHQPHRVIVAGGKSKITLSTQHIFINNAEKYSEEFVALLKEYYLFL